MLNYATNTGRVNKIKGEILAHAVPVEVLALGCKMKPMAKNQGDNIVYRRWLPFGATSSTVHTQNRPVVTAAAHALSEGVTPTADSMTPVDVSVTIQQFGCLYSYTDKTADLYEDDMPDEMKTQTGERMGLVREMIRFGSLKAASNVMYAGGTTRLTVDEAIGLNILRRMTKTLKRNHAKKKTRILSASANYDTSAIEAGFIVFVSSDAEPDIRDLPNFVPVAKYANRSPINEFELGSCEEFRFICSPELTPYADSGASVGATGLVSTGASTIDVYPFIVMGEEAAFDIALRGLNSFNVTHLPHTQKDKSDPLGQRGYVGATFWSAVLVTNGGWMGVIEAGVTDV
ncbi:MAG: N4-gp56 family major capsid protein [Gammaproteobacteria bacterium RIFCSPHIGHO2_12_FULL_63_22]|nr:MAG: N4-gp56 family major capsid protein [Gammaproteobacteria bacterium RIFCSPHIGHO2_12_FULL_63_22]